MESEDLESAISFLEKLQDELSKICELRADYMTEDHIRGGRGLIKVNHYYWQAMLKISIEAIKKSV